MSVHQDRLQLAIHWTNNGMIILHVTGNQFVDHESKIHPIIHNSCAVFSFSGYKTQQLIDRLGWYTQDHRFWFGTNIRISQQKLFSHRCHEVMYVFFQAYISMQLCNHLKVAKRFLNALYNY